MSYFDDLDLALQSASQQERIGDPRFATYDVGHDGGDPMVDAAGGLYDGRAAWHAMIQEHCDPMQRLIAGTLDDC